LIDLHSHILPGIDDGPATIEDSLALARAAAAAGTRTIVATPHVNPRYHNDAAAIAGLTGELNVRLAVEEIALEVLPGAEIAITGVVEIEPSASLRASALGAGDGCSWSHRSRQSQAALRTFCRLFSATAIASCWPTRSGVRPSTATHPC
jgi:dihydroorotase-like cyclic amidohydrolase